MIEGDSGNLKKRKGSKSSKKVSRQEQFIKAQPLSPGIAIGVLHFMESELEDVESSFSIDAKDWPSLLDKTKAQLKKQLVSRSLEKLEKSILSTQIEILNDSSFVSEVSGFLEEKLSLKQALEKSLNQWKAKFKEAKSVLFQQRVFDLQDVLIRIMNVAHDKIRKKRPRGLTCLYIKQALPSCVLEISREKLAAVICESGSMASHLAIIAKSRKLPCLSKVRLPFKDEEVPVIVDANEGWLILNPTEATLSQYAHKRQEPSLQETEKEKKRLSIKWQAAQIKLWASVNSWTDVQDIPKAGIEGIGLVRSEFFAYEYGSLPNLKSQIQLYSRLVKSQGGKPVVFRLFDFGSDKPLLSKRMAPEINPAMGCRGIRLLLKEPQILKDQLRALLIASLEGPLSILVPMVCVSHEMEAVRRLCKDLARELKLAQVPKIGMMVEIPAVAYRLDPFVEISDFFSVGTNDLLQYLFAVDRANQQIADLYNPLDPALLQLIEGVVNTSKKFSKPVSFCGEMASNPTCLRALLKLGVSDYSVSVTGLKNLNVHFLDKK